MDRFHSGKTVNINKTLTNFHHFYQKADFKSINFTLLK